MLAQSPPPPRYPGGLQQIGFYFLLSVPYAFGCIAMIPFDEDEDWEDEDFEDEEPEEDADEDF